MTEDKNLDPETGKPWEEVAQEMGWQPPEEFSGDPEKFTSAEDFVTRGREFVPFLKKTNANLERERRELKALIEEQKAFNERNLKSERDRLQREYDERVKQIVADGDIEAYEKLEKPQASGPDPAVGQFIVDNPWYGTDVAMTAAADGLSAKFANDFPGLTASQNLEKVKQTLMAEFPHKFQNGKEPPRESSVEGGRRMPKKKSGHTYDDLPAEAKAVCDSFIKQGIIKDRKDYVATYDWEE